MKLSWRIQAVKMKSVFKYSWFGFFNTDCPIWLTTVTAKEGQ